MSRWWRAYDEAVDDPKLQRLTGEHFKAWFNLCCLTSQNGGVLPDLDVVAFKLRMKPDKAAKVMATLRDAGLLDDGETGIAPHNWNVRQYKSDVSNERVQRHRERKRNGECNVTPTVTVTPPETDTEAESETEKITDATASDAGASRDIRADLFGNGLKTLANITGKTPDSCRSLVGKWLKSVNDEAVHVLGAIEDAERNRVADPVAWISRSLNLGVSSEQTRVHRAPRNGGDLARELAREVREREIEAGIFRSDDAVRGH